MVLWLCIVREFVILDRCSCFSSGVSLGIGLIIVFFFFNEGVVYLGCDGIDYCWYKYCLRY